MAPKSRSPIQSSEEKSRKQSSSDRESDDYRRRRERNNEAVKKSREKSRKRARETMERVNELKQENVELESRVNVLSKELTILKDLLLSRAGSRRSQPANAVVLPSKSGFEAKQQRSGGSADLIIVNQDHEYSVKV